MLGIKKVLKGILGIKRYTRYSKGILGIKKVYLVLKRYTRY